MLRRRTEVFRTTLLLIDLLFAAVAWLVAYHVRFYSVFPAPLGIPEFGPYLAALVLILPLWGWVFRVRGLYAPRRTEGMVAEIADVFGAVTTVVVILVFLTFFLRSYFFSRGVILLFYALSIGTVAAYRVLARKLVRIMHGQGHNLASVLVVGGGRLAEHVIECIHEHPEAGLRVVGVLTENPELPRVRGVPTLGRYEQVKKVLQLCQASQVILALPREESGHVEQLLAQLDDELVDVRLVPDLLHIVTLRSSVEDFDGMPMIALRDTPLVGWAAIQKRIFDIVVAGAVLLISAPLVGAIAAALWLRHGRPILYTQERMGLDGRVFRMIKFRTMKRDAERDTGPVWARRGDPRQTRLGRFLRRTSLDELPQLWNVLRGDMSLVGPRPERPVFIEQFRREVPGYMLRHKVKAGLTGWAQIHRWRGDTSVHERIEHDLYYIQNWSLGLDVRILLMTLWRSRLPS
ncbi:MAG: undecaprenyl-phosphate glucose phosphotransferase [Myxococcota bacterium]|nr:undecaprenyl-phosphate glucose phosphotransferase [Myxococcota bacterium]